MNYEKVKFKILPRLLDNIGLAMYSSIPKAISELVANSYDACASEVFVNIKKNNSNQISGIVIKDDGEGMSPNEIKDLYLVLGLNRRHVIKKIVKCRRKPIGNKGIGKLAGLGISKKMKIISFKNGEKSTLEISRKKFEDETIDLSSIEFPLKKENFKDKSKNGTEVHLSSLLEHAARIIISDLREFLAKEFLFTRNFNIYVEDQKISPFDIQGEKRKIKEEIKGLGIISGKIIVANQTRDVKKPGIVTYVRGRAIEGPTLYDINTPSHHYRVADRIIGEINADFLDPEKPKKLIDNYIISTSRDGFNRSNQKYLNYRNWVENLLKKFARKLEKKQSKERLETINKNPNIQRILRSLPKPLREKFEISVKAIVPKLSNLSEENANTVIEFIARLAETESMLQILEKINQANPSDLKVLAGLLEEWGIYEITAISTLIKSRLEVIKKIEEMINDASTREFPDMHRILEKNLWILNDNYKLYRTNKQLKTILEDKLLPKHRKYGKKRPDLICKSLINNYLVIELKKPSYKITAKDYPQVMTYSTILTSGFPTAEQLDCYLIGKEYDSAMSKEPNKQGKVIIYLKSYNEIIEEAKQRYEEVLDIFSKGDENE